MCFLEPFFQERLQASKELAGKFLFGVGHRTAPNHREYPYLIVFVPFVTIKNMRRNKIPPHIFYGQIFSLTLDALPTLSRR